MIFLTGFIQVLLISLNTAQISHGHILGATIVSFLISWTWTANVRRVSSGTTKDRLSYASGAAVGTLTAMILWSLYV